MVGCKELCTPVNPAVLEDPQTSTYEDAVDLFSYLSSIATSSSAVHLWSLVPRPLNSRPSRFCQI